MQGPDESVLLVDDEPRVLAALRRRLSDRFTILTAESAGQAVKILESDENVGAIVADMKMPGRDGLDLLVEVTRRWPNIRRLMLTGNTDQDTAVAAVNRGRVFRFFRKPCDADLLAGALGEALDEFRFISHASIERHSIEIRAEASERARKAFLTMMSHELLTPLNHVLGFSSMLEIKLKGTEESEALEYLTYIKDSGEALLKMVQRVLEIVRFTSNDAGRDQQIVDVASVIGEELNKVRKKAELRNISMSFQSPSDPVFIETNEYELRFALGELLDNAVKFNDKGGHVTVAVSGQTGTLTIRIADTGAGMTEEAVERALGLFGPGDDWERRRFGGIGLGLTFVAFFARAWNGRLAIETEKDRGTAIMLTLPRAEQAEEIARIA
jgi:signal transduction histidine kinase